MPAHRYHVHVRPPVPREFESALIRAIPVASFDTYEDARQRAYHEYTNCELDTLVEISHAGVLVWGPHIVGGKFKP